MREISIGARLAQSDVMRSSCRGLVVALGIFLIAMLAACSAETGPAADDPAQKTMAAPLPDVDGDGADVSDDGVIGDVGDMEDGPLVAANDDVAGVEQVLAGATTMKATSNLNLRKGAGTSYAVILVIPAGAIVELVSPTMSGSFYNVKYAGSTGWSHSAYLTPVTSTSPPPAAVDVNGAPSPDNAIARSAAAVGFSYYWGGGAWVASGATSSNKGSCSGSCPSCSHSGKYGADCSGLVAKAWQYGTKALEVNSHPYSTASFVNDVSGKWYTVSRGAMKRGDALVYNSNGAGHIVVYEKGDGWGSPTVYECRGCAYGCVHNTRSFGSNYHAIRRSGF